MSRSSRHRNSSDGIGKQQHGKNKFPENHRFGHRSGYLKMRQYRKYYNFTTAVLVVGMSRIAVIRMRMYDPGPVDDVNMRKSVDTPVIAGKYGQQ